MRVSNNRGHALDFENTRTQPGNANQGKENGEINDALFCHQVHHKIQRNSSREQNKMAGYLRMLFRSNLRCARAICESDWIQIRIRVDGQGAERRKKSLRFQISSDTCGRALRWQGLEREGSDENMLLQLVCGLFVKYEMFGERHGNRNISSE